MKLTKPTAADLNCEYHRLIGRTTLPVPDYCAGDDRAAVYDRVKALGDLPMKVEGRQEPGAEFMTMCIILPDRPWCGYGTTLLEAWIYLLLTASGVEIER